MQKFICFSILRRLFIRCVWFLVVASPLAATAQTDCIANALSGYKGGACVVHIDRSNLASPAAMTVPKGTQVIIQLDNVRWNETLQFNPVTTQNLSQDVLTTVLKTILPNLQVLAASQQAGHALAAAVDPIVLKQSHITERLTQVALTLSNTTTELTCLETYKARAATPAGKAFACSLNSLYGPLPLPPQPQPPPPTPVYDPHDTFSPAKDAVIVDLKTAAGTALPIDSLADIDTDIKARLASCNALADPSAKVSCLRVIDQFQTNQDRFKSIIAAMEKVQQTLQTNALTLEQWAGTPSSVSWPIIQTRNRTSTVTIVATEIVSGTSTTLGTVNITWQTQPFVLSTGILLSGMPSRSFSIGQTIVNGATVPDTNGKPLSQVNETITKPSIVFPMVYGSWRIGFLSRYNWENRCWNHCAFLLSGGIGANLTNKTADFAVGPSFQLGGVLFTPSAHFGRETALTNGFTVNQNLGSAPPTALTTKNQWTTHFGFGLTYVIPTP